MDRIDHVPGEVHLHDPQVLYRHWEDEQWSPFAIDLGPDRAPWEEMQGEDRSLVLWALSSLMVAEERITTKFSGLVGAYGTEEEATFLATQQVDEARHMQFFDRFYREVVDGGDPDIHARLARVREHVNDAFVQLFDESLVEAGRRLIADPRSAEAKVDFVTAYHMVIEGTLALTGQWTLTDYWEKTGRMPGFLDGFKKVARDEHRHVAYGTWYLKKACAENPELADRVRACLHELLPTASGVLVPPGQDPNDWELLGYTSEQVNKFAFTSLTRRLKVIGVTLTAPEPAAAEPAAA
jgi:ribonucleoside-diphosphate reductase beta chain